MSTTQENFPGWWIASVIILILGIVIYSSKNQMESLSNSADSSKTVDSSPIDQGALSVAKNSLENRFVCEHPKTETPNANAQYAQMEARDLISTYQNGTSEDRQKIEEQGGLLKLMVNKEYEYKNNCDV